MDDEFPSQTRPSISLINPESSSFEPSSYSQHIQPTTNDQYDNSNYYSTTIHSIEPSEQISSQPHYIQETTSDNQHPTSSYHIEPVNTSHHDDDKNEQNTNQIPFRQSTNINNESNFDIQTNLNDQSNELKTQHELDDDEIPSVEIPIDQSSTVIENNNISNELKSNIIDTRPLTKLETPYEQNPTKESLNSLPDVVPEKKHDDSVSQTEPDDILGNKSLLKEIITPGTPNTRPIRNTVATVSYKLFLIDDKTSNSRLIETITNESFFVNDSDILPAIDISIQLMDRGEHAFIYSDIRHCYGEMGCEEKQIPSVSSNNSYRMKIDLELHDWKHVPDIQTLSIDERLFWSDKKRQRGNFLYRRKDSSTALQCYRSSLKFVDTDEYPLLEEDERLSLFIDRYIQVQNNLAQVHLLNNQYEQCLDAVNQVLKYDSKNIKALFRQAKALFELGNYDQTIPSLKLLLQSQNKDVEKDKVNEMLNICEIKVAKYKKNEKEIYKRMFSSSTSTKVDQKLQTKTIQKVENKTNNAWWTYIAMGSAVLAAVGLAAIIKYR
ncbi:unnamed protein product [Rotaria sordida]|uniref:peptidylprolyl isomerase n=1 Tax=Rotaria sordida TaxID=392033 RepID=A0A819JAL6_9BILA|nr:unnamed protein product [Rotaria sordida]